LLKLVETLAEQAALEEFLEATKPPVPEDCRHLSTRTGSAAMPWRRAATGSPSAK